MSAEYNRRVLVVDDEPSLHQDFRFALEAHPEGAGASRLADLEATMFGDSLPSHQPGFALESALQGRQAVELARAALAEQRPFAVAFVDMRMPPGWDGVETVKHLWSLDARMQVVFCTAYSDYSWDKAFEELEGHERLLVVKKPFDPVEVRQAAAVLSAKWSLERLLEAR